MLLHAVFSLHMHSGSLTITYHKEFIVLNKLQTLSHTDNQVCYAILNFCVVFQLQQSADTSSDSTNSSVVAIAVLVVLLMVSLVCNIVLLVWVFKHLKQKLSNEVKPYAKLVYS